MTMRRILILIALGFLAAVASAAGPDPRTSRYDTSNGGKWAGVLNFTATTDTTIGTGWEWCMGRFIRGNTDIVVQPIFRDSVLIRDPGADFTGRPDPNPRAGQPLRIWGPDTLSTSHLSTSICCGDLAGFRLTSLGTGGWIYFYLSGRCN